MLDIKTDRTDGWTARAACLDLDVDLFFTPARRREALKVCAGCEVAADCLAHANRHHMHEAGVFGGTTPQQRQRAAGWPDRRRTSVRAGLPSAIDMLRDGLADTPRPRDELLAYVAGRLMAELDDGYKTKGRGAGRAALLRAEKTGEVVIVEGDGPDRIVALASQLAAV